MRTTRRTKGAVLEAPRDDPMPRRPRSRATSVASSQVSNDDRHVATIPAAIARLAAQPEEDSIIEDRVYTPSPRKQTPKRRTLRNQHLTEQVEEYRAQHQTDKEEDPPTQTGAQQVESQEQQEQTPRPPKAPEQSATPATQTVALKTSTPEAPATVPRWRQLLSSLGGFSPFPSRRTNTPRAEPAEKRPPAANLPLGELPQNRKRPAPEPEKEETPTKKAKTPEPEPQQSAAPLESISEQAALPAQLFAAQTPTRLSRKMSAPRTEQITRVSKEPETTPRRRTIKDVRSAKVTRTSVPVTTRRQWETPSKPREPNADKRLARMQQLEKLREEKKRMEEEIAKLAAEQEADGIDTRKRKRVKVDELAYIPHNMPGDAASTFRVPEWDSDDEMEVDDEVPVRQNVFSMNAEKQVSDTPAPAAKPPAPSPAKAPRPAQPPAAVAPQAAVPPKALFAQPAIQEQTPVVQQKIPEPLKQTPASLPKPNMFKPAPPAAAIPPAPAVKAAPVAGKFQWPSVGSKQYTDDWTDADKIAGGRKFARGFESWLSAGVTA